MTYKINGTALSTQPTTGDWITLDSVDDDMFGRPIYPQSVDFEMKWQWASPALFSQILAFWSAISASGTCVAELPQYGHSTYQFYAYSGCVLTRPVFSEYFEGFQGDISIMVRNAKPLLLAIS